MAEPSPLRSEASSEVSPGKPSAEGDQPSATEPAADAHAQSDAQPSEEHHAEHGAHGGAHGGGGHHGGKHGGHGGGDGHGGGHGGGAWIITYCDMITLLIAFFICILTFASKESGKQKHAKLRDSILYGPGGSGLAGATQKGGDQDALVWRQVLTSAQPGPPGSRIPPTYSDPAMERTAEVLRVLEESSLKSFAEGYAMEFPMAIFFDESRAITDTGKRLLARIANHLRQLPYDIFLQPNHREQLDKAVLLTRHLATQDGLDPARLGVGLRDEAPGWNRTIRFVLVPRLVPRS